MTQRHEEQDWSVLGEMGEPWYHTSIPERPMVEAELPEIYHVPAEQPTLTEQIDALPPLTVWNNELCVSETDGTLRYPTDYEIELYRIKAGLLALPRRITTTSAPVKPYLPGVSMVEFEGPTGGRIHASITAEWAVTDPNDKESGQMAILGMLSGLGGLAEKSLSKKQERLPITPESYAQPRPETSLPAHGGRAALAVPESSNPDWLTLDNPQQPSNAPVKSRGVDKQYDGRRASKQQERPRRLQRKLIKYGAIGALGLATSLLVVERGETAIYHWAAAGAADNVSSFWSEQGRSDTAKFAVVGSLVSKLVP